MQHDLHIKTVLVLSLYDVPFRRYRLPNIFIHNSYTIPARSNSIVILTRSAEQRKFLEFI